ncbi:MAG: hemolysin III family protein [Firmicutes bacterium]|nr:hemolysin III family protein [Bacillota bacterium]
MENSQNAENCQLQKSDIKKAKTIKKEAKKAEKKLRNENERKNRRYTVGEEIANSITHGIGALLSIFIVVYGILNITEENGKVMLTTIGLIVFAICLVICYGISAVYHSLGINSGKRTMRVLDHCGIYFLIAGTYTPFCLVVLTGWLGYTIMAVNWTAAIVGTTLTAVNREKYKKFAMICYLAMGWIIIIAIFPLIEAMGLSWALLMLLNGGIAYTVGAVIYMKSKRKKYGHSIWHLFTLMGTVFHIIAIMLVI